MDAPVAVHGSWGGEVARSIMGDGGHGPQFRRGQTASEGLGTLGGRDGVAHEFS